VNIKRAVAEYRQNPISRHAKGLSFPFQRGGVCIGGIQKLLPLSPLRKGLGRFDQPPT